MRTFNQNHIQNKRMGEDSQPLQNERASTDSLSLESNRIPKRQFSTFHNPQRIQEQPQNNSEVIQQNDINLGKKKSFNSFKVPKNPQRFDETPQTRLQSTPFQNPSQSQSSFLKQHTQSKVIENQEGDKKKEETQVGNVSNKNLKKSHKLSAAEFYVKYYSLIKEVIDSVLTVKFGSKVAQAIENKEVRKDVENGSFEDIRNYLNSKNLPDLDYQRTAEYINLIFSEGMGLGILEPLLNDKNVDEIVVMTHDKIYAEIGGVLTLTEYQFPTYDAALGIARRIIRPLNKALDVSNPNVDGQLPDGSRLSASIPPLRAENQISIDIRKFSDKVQPLIFYSKKFQSSTPEMVKFIEACVSARKTLIVSGGTGSGKTTLLNSLSYAIGEKERILVIEDTREIRVQVPHVEYYLSVPGNAEGYKGISIAQIIQNALRKRPDRIIVGECRGGEFNEYLNAANTGHDGSMTSIHANSPQDLFSRMENMLLKNDETKNMTHEAIMRTLASSVNIIIQQKRLADGSRRITNVTEVLGYGQDGFDKLKKMGLTKEGQTCDPNRVYLRDIFYFKENNTIEEEGEDGSKKLKVKGQYIATGYVPFCNKELKRKGYKFDKEFFKNRILMEV